MRWTILLLLTFLVACKKEKHTSIYMMGDSHIARFDNRYWLPTWQMQNIGVGGMKILELENNLEEKGDIGIVEIGTNDILAGIQSGMPDTSVINMITKDYRNLLTKLQNNFKKIFIIEILPPAKGYKNYSSLAKIYKASNEGLKNLVQNNSNVILVEIGSLIDEDEYYLADRYSMDNLHLSYKGYDRFSQIIARYVR